MTINLTSYVSIQSGLFVRMEVADYAPDDSTSPTSQVLRFSDFTRAVTINSETYNPLGQLLSITSSASELRVSGGTITITISGIPDSKISEIVNSRIKGSPVEIYRVFFNASTGEQLAITGNPQGRFFGIVNNYSLQEEYNIDGRVSSNSIVITCSSRVEVLNNKIAGRRTNPYEQKVFFTSDVSMDRVPNLVGAYYDFGVKK